MLPTKPDRLLVAQHPAGVMRSLPQISRARPSIQVRPQLLNHPVARKPMTVGKCQQGHQLPRPPRWPIPLPNLPLADNDPETTQKLNTHIPNRSPHATILANTGRLSRLQGGSEFARR